MKKLAVIALVLGLSTIALADESALTVDNTGLSGPYTGVVSIELPSGDTHAFHDAVSIRLDDRVLLAQADTGSGAGSTAPAPTVDAGSAATTTALPNPAEDPQASASMLWKLYKAGHLVPAIILGSFFLLTLLQRWIAWLRTGWRKLAVSSVLAGGLMLAERAADGTTPNLTMIMGALGAAFAMWVNAKGQPKS